MVKNKAAEVSNLFDLPEDEQWTRVTQPNAHYMERLAQIHNRNIHSERGIETAGLETTTILATIARRQWFRFTSPPWSYHEGLVREFYAAMVPEVFKAHGLVWVRETQVQISPQAINAYLGTPDVPECAHFGGLPSGLVHQLGYDTLAGNLAASLRRDGRRVWGPNDSLLQHGDLHPEMAFWTVFINYHLMGAHHRTTVNMETAQILYAIQHDLQFDVGRIIFDQILSVGYDLRSLLYFPGLITHFCRQVDINEASNIRYLTKPQKEMGKKAYNYFCTTHGLPNLPTAGGYRNRGRGGGRGAAAQPQPAAGQGGVPPPPFGGYPEDPPPWAQQLIQDVGGLRNEYSSMRTMMSQLMGQSSNQPAPERARPQTVNVYSRGHRNVVLQPGESSRQNNDSDSD